MFSQPRLNLILSVPLFFVMQFQGVSSFSQLSLFSGLPSTSSHRPDFCTSNVPTFKTTHVAFMSSSVNNDNSSDNEQKQVESKNNIDPESLIDMDIIFFVKKDDPSQKQYVGAIQEDSTLAPLSAWTIEPAFGNSIEFVVDEEDRWMKELEFDNIEVKMLLSEDLISYGSRQVGGGKGPGNPHGEESELIYYIENEILQRENAEISIKPGLEILW
mmetsp:Transcript_18624/g.21513  ORF Transcript_18624/g.21513 Transcript_18624/m.21513 type:complete len:215 (+) Transcript_18624:146-790(+)